MARHRYTGSATWDEDVWEEVDKATVRRALGEAYRDVSLALDSLHKAGSNRTPVVLFEDSPPEMSRRLDGLRRNR